MKKGLIAYIDGSFNSQHFVYGSGVIIINNNEINEFKHASQNIKHVAGECEASKFSMYYAYSNNIPEITIYHDYIGVGAWCTGTWKAKNDYTQGYKAYFEKISKKVKVNFVKVEAHSGVFYNEKADTLAKNAILEFIKTNKI